MNRKVLLKLIVCDMAIMLLGVGASVLASLKIIPWTEMHPVFYFTVGDMTIPVAFALLMVLFVWTSMKVLKPCNNWHKVMVFNALIVMAMGIGLGYVLFYCTSFNMLAVVNFNRMMFWIGIVSIVLSFPIRLLKRKGLIA